MANSRSKAANGLRELVDWAAGVALEDIPAPVLKRAALILADDLAAMVAARDEPEVVHMHEQLLGRTASAEATIFRGGRPKTDRYSAALANGVAGNWCELDEGYRKVPSHPGIYVLPGLLAEAEAEGLTAGEVLRATALAYEIVGRIAQTFYFPQPRIHPHARYSALGAAAAIGLARGLDCAQLLNAVSAATTLSLAGPQNHVIKGALIENTWAGLGVQAGMRAADWAVFGVGGLADSPYDVYVEALGAEFRPEHLCADLGQEWAVQFGFNKLYATCGRTHAAVEATLGLLDELPSGDACRIIERVELDVHDPQLDNYDPPTGLAARFSFPHVIACVLVYRHADANAFAAGGLASPEVTELRKRIGIRPFAPPQPWPDDRAARVTIRLKDGRVLVREVTIARGTPDRPLSDLEIVAKVEALAGAVYPRLAQVATQLVALDPVRMNQRWGACVEDFTGAEIDHAPRHFAAG